MIKLKNLLSEIRDDERIAKDMIKRRMVKKGQNEKEKISAISQYLKKYSGWSSTKIRYSMGFDQDFLPDVLSMISYYLKESINEASDDQIQVPGIGMYTYDTLKKKVQGLAKDLDKNAKRGIWRKSSKNAIRAFAEMWNALADYERRH